MAKQWEKSLIINAPIDDIWRFLDGGLEDLQEVMPNVVDHKVMKKTDSGIGSIHRQKYRVGNKLLEYDVHTLEYMNQKKHKKLTLAFELTDMCKINCSYELFEVSKKVTKLRYYGVNEPLRWYIAPIVLISGDTIVKEFILKMKQVAEDN
ncbi:MAG: SRPBCC family protein [Anaerobacillus sp.]